MKGFFIWPWMDNMETGSGYSVRFGLNYMDYLDNLRHHPTKSAKWICSFLKESKSKGLDYDLSDVTFCFFFFLVGLAMFCMVHCWCWWCTRIIIEEMSSSRYLAVNSLHLVGVLGLVCTSLLSSTKF